MTGVVRAKVQEGVHPCFANEMKWESPMDDKTRTELEAAPHPVSLFLIGMRLAPCLHG